MDPIKLKVIEWLEKEKTKPCQYVGDTDDLTKVSLDGWFNIDELVDIIVYVATKAETIICSAIKTDDGEIVRGHRHCHCFATANDIPRLRGRKDWEQGFMTSKNRFVGRKEAYDLFVQSGAVSVDEAVHPMKDRNELYSEDLY